MDYSKEKLTEIREMLDALIKGVDPSTGEVLENAGVLEEPSVIRALFTVSRFVNDMLAGNIATKKTGVKKFHLTDEQMKRIEFPDDEIGVNAFVKCVNQVIDDPSMKKLSGTGLNNKLKQMGILGSEKSEKGGSRTITNETSEEYGFKTVEINYNGQEYEKIIYTDKARRYVLDNINEIME